MCLFCHSFCFVVVVFVSFFLSPFSSCNGYNANCQNDTKQRYGIVQTKKKKKKMFFYRLSPVFFILFFIFCFWCLVAASKYNFLYSLPLSLFLAPMHVHTHTALQLSVVWNGPLSLSLPPCTQFPHISCMRTFLPSRTLTQIYVLTLLSLSLYILFFAPSLFAALAFCFWSISNNKKKVEKILKFRLSLTTCTLLIRQKKKNRVSI